MTTPRSAGVQVIAACLTAFIIAVDNIAIASLLFQGPALERNLSVGLKYVLAGAAVNQLFLSATCEYEVAIAVACAESLPFLIPAVAGIVESMPGASDDAILATVLCALTISSLLAGVIFILLGLFRLSWLLNFVPEAVVKGLYAAVGWLSFTYCFDITTGMSLLPANFAALGTAFYVARWLPAIVLGLVLYIVDDQVSDPKKRAAPECTSPLLVAPLFPSRSPPRGPFLLRFIERTHALPSLFLPPLSSSVHRHLLAIHLPDFLRGGNIDVSARVWRRESASLPSRRRSLALPGTGRHCEAVLRAVLRSVRPFRSHLLECDRR